MSYLLDTNIVIYHLNDLVAANDLVDELFDDGIAISIITFAEVMDGIARSRDPRLARRRFSALVR